MFVHSHSFAVFLQMALDQSFLTNIASQEAVLADRFWELEVMPPEILA
jgi:hypothetical protein